MNLISFAVSVVLVALFWYYLRHRYPGTDKYDLAFLLLLLLGLSAFFYITGFVGPWASGNLTWRGFLLEWAIILLIVPIYVLYLRKVKKR